MGVNKLWLTGTGMGLLLIVTALLAPLFFKNTITSLTENFLTSINTIGFTELGIMTLFSVKDMLLLILSISLVRFLVSFPIGVYAAEKKGLPHLFVKSIFKFYSTVPILLLAVLLINLPFIIFSHTHFYWIVLILALLGVGPLSHAIQHDSHKLTLRKKAIRAKKDGENWGPRFILEYIMPYLYPTLILEFLLDLGRVTVLLTQLALLSIFINVVYTPLEFNFGVLTISKLDWIALLGHAKGLISHNPLLPLIPMFAFLYTYLMFIILAEAFRRTFYEKQGSILSSSLFEEAR